MDKDAHPSQGIFEIAVKYGLTKREQQALFGISTGLSNKEVAERMNISPNTVKSFLHIIMLKMGVTTRAEIAERIQSASMSPEPQGPALETHSNPRIRKAAQQRRRGSSAG